MNDCCSFASQREKPVDHLNGFVIAKRNEGGKEKVVIFVLLVWFVGCLASSTPYEREGDAQ
jgi:hypothetical protein